MPQCERPRHRAEDHRGKFRQGGDQTILESNIITDDAKGSRCAEVSFQPSSIAEKAIGVHDVSFQSIMRCPCPRGRQVRDDGVDRVCTIKVENQGGEHRVHEKANDFSDGFFVRETAQDSERA